jgi:hypothetical protein
MRTIALVAAAAVLALTAGTDGHRLLERTHLVGACSAIATPRGETGAWQACRPGRLEGRPDLSASSCLRRDLVADVELWRCPARVDDSRTA